MIKRRSSEEKQALVAEFRRSGMPQTRFCAEHKIAVQTFKGWLKRTKATFVELPLSGEKTTVEITFPDGTAVRIGTRS